MTVPAQPPPAGSLRALWSGTEWRAEAEAWIGAVLTSHGLRVTGPIEQPRLRVWSTQLTVPTNAGVMWFKENSPGQRFEAGLVAVMASVADDHVVTPLATEDQRGWLLSPDQGPTLASLNATDAAIWTRVVGDFADLQRRLQPHESALLATGLPELLPSMVAGWVDETVEQLASLPRSDPRRGSSDQATRIRSALPRLRAAAAVLDAGPVGLSLEHNDLHHNNTFLPGDETAALRFFDFADALWAHPFSSLRITLNVIVNEWRTTAEDPRVATVVDAYLERWSDLAPRRDLHGLLDAALVLAPVHRAASWLRVLDPHDTETLAEFGQTPLVWLETLTSPTA